MFFNKNFLTILALCFCSTIFSARIKGEFLEKLNAAKENNTVRIQQGKIVGKIGSRRKVRLSKKRSTQGLVVETAAQAKKATLAKLLAHNKAQNTAKEDNAVKALETKDRKRLEKAKAETKERCATRMPKNFKTVKKVVAGTVKESTAV